MNNLNFGHTSSSASNIVSTVILAAGINLAFYQPPINKTENIKPLKLPYTFELKNESSASHIDILSQYENQAILRGKFNIANEDDNNIQLFIEEKNLYPALFSMSGFISEIFKIAKVELSIYVDTPDDGTEGTTNLLVSIFAPNTDLIQIIDLEEKLITTISQNEILENGLRHITISATQEV